MVLLLQWKSAVGEGKDKRILSEELGFVNWPKSLDIDSIHQTTLTKCVILFSRYLAFCLWPDSSEQQARNNLHRIQPGQ